MACKTWKTALINMSMKAPGRATARRPAVIKS
jgi:hypothetical protein